MIAIDFVLIAKTGPESGFGGGSAGGVGRDATDVA
jgi:hypothetical protein